MISFIFFLEAALFNSVLIPPFSDCWLISVTRENIHVFSFAFSDHRQLGQIIEFGDRTLTILPENHIGKFRRHIFLFYVICFFFLNLGKIFILDVIFSTSKCVSLFTKSTVKPFKLEVFFFISGKFSSICIFEIGSVALVLIAASFTPIMHKPHILCSCF